MNHFIRAWDNTFTFSYNSFYAAEFLFCLFVLRKIYDVEENKLWLIINTPKMTFLKKCALYIIINAFYFRKDLCLLTLEIFRRKTVSFNLHFQL